MSFNQEVHVEEDVEFRLDAAWDFKPTDQNTSQQNFVVMCVVAPEGTNQKCPSLAIKIFGCFPTKEAADKYAQKLSLECNFWDYFVASTKEWLKLPPQVESLEDVHYQEGALTNIKQKILDTRTAAAKLMQDRIAADKASRKEKKLET